MRQRKRKRTIAPLAAVAAVAALSAISISGDQRTGAGRAVTAQTRSAQGSVVVRDPDSGQLVEPTAQDLIDLQSQSAQTATAPEPIVSAAGIEGLRLGDDQMTFTVATRRADGTVNVAHAAGKKDAERQVREGVRGLVAGKEQVLER